LDKEENGHADHAFEEFEETGFILCFGFHLCDASNFVLYAEDDEILKKRLAWFGDAKMHVVH
jgi:hypothetical protein